MAAPTGSDQPVGSAKHTEIDAFRSLLANAQSKFEELVRENVKLEATIHELTNANDYLRALSSLEEDSTDCKDADSTLRPDTTLASVSEEEKPLDFTNRTEVTPIRAAADPSPEECDISRLQSPTYSLFSSPRPVRSDEKRYTLSGLAHASEASENPLTLCSTKSGLQIVDKFNKPSRTWDFPDRSDGASPGESPGDCPSSLPSGQEAGEYKIQQSTSRDFFALGMAGMHSDADDLEEFRELRHAFLAALKPGKNTITASDLQAMRIQQKRAGAAKTRSSKSGSKELTIPDDQVLPLYKDAVLALNQAAGTPYKAEIGFETYLAVFQDDDLLLPGQIQDPRLEQAVGEVRHLLVKDDTTRKIARLAHARTSEVFEYSLERTSSRLANFMKYLDPIIGFVIIANAAVIGVSSDYPDWGGWVYIEILFTLTFTLEVVLKITFHGLSVHFFGPDWAWNWFDGAVILLAVIDLFFTMMGSLVSLNKLTLVRLLRFLRLTKLVRVLRLRVFKELTLLINGCLAGVRTLFWAIIFLGFFIYCIGVLLKQTIGQMDEPVYEWCIDPNNPGANSTCQESIKIMEEYRYALFGTVGRSMFTVFRCFTDGCSASNGTPLPVHFMDAYGPLLACLWVLCTLFVIFGLFNLIMAIFVENTIENGKHDDNVRKQQRQKEQLRVARKLQALIIRLCSRHAPDRPEETPVPALLHQRIGERIRRAFRKLFSTTSVAIDDSSSDVGKYMSGSAASGMLDTKITHASFQRMLEKKEIIGMLDDLDISSNCRKNLFGCLDSDGNGSLTISELVRGLLRLRGEPEKSDIVAILLSMRSVQARCRTLESIALTQQCTLGRLEENQKVMAESLRKIIANPRR